ncbi:potassium channel family protein [Butyrivibrio sp. VCB2001]|uniref:potassium channel family protein n=1 Tax=Butyrivibrio sp. VCB2001 TaxID=1280667 RepID=UPI00041167B2|nr:TrkA family potassium uptake protein [Butyrivibrio sp. VCB2001]
MGKSVAVLGLGKYGKSLAENLYMMGADVLAVDKDKELINEFAGKCTSAVCANLENEDEVEALGLKNMDIVVCATGNLAAAIMSVAVAKEKGVPLIVAKTSSDRMSSILLKIGVDKILDPEGEGGMRSARILLSKSFKDFLEIDSNMYIVEMYVKDEWVGKNLIELGLRQKHRMNVIAVRKKDQKWGFSSPNEPLERDMVLLIAMEKKDVNKWH